MAINIFVTHSGGFHADELLSSVVLTRLFPEASLMRSRDELCITPATDKIIYDVGGNYETPAIAIGCPSALPEWRQLLSA